MKSMTKRNIKGGHGDKLQYVCTVYLLYIHTYIRITLHKDNNIL